MLFPTPFLAALRISAAVAAVAGAYGCGMTPTIPGLPPYRIEVQQGNYVSQEMVAQLKPGMTRDQVRFVLGTPLVASVFHADRWDYVYFREPPGKPREQRRLAVFFENDRLSRVAGDVVPAAPAPVAEPDAAPAPSKPAAEAKPAPKPEAVRAEPEPPRQNWSTASDQPEPKPAPPPAEPAAKPAAQADGERGFFGRMLDRLKGSE